jgi:4-hydroxybenzoate polyprenyltransferase
MATLKQWIKVTRVQTAAVTMLALWVGHIVVEPLTIWSASMLGLIGLCIHVWGFTLNEVYDAEYDKIHGKDGDHLIAKGVIPEEEAKMLAWGAGATSLILYMILVDSLMGVLALLLSFGHGYAYDIRSKKDWFSNIYLAFWVFFVATAGALSAGNFNFAVAIIGTVLAIQIFIQVTEGDLKDLTGPERTFAERLGVTIDYDSQNIVYPARFKAFVLSAKVVEVVLLYYLLMTAQDFTGISGIVPLGLFILLSIVFGRTLRGWMVEDIDRDLIKEQSSKHEIVSIVLIGVSLVGYDVWGSLLVALSPVVWYIGVNKVIHKGSLNPDV